MTASPEFGILTRVVVGLVGTGIGIIPAVSGIFALVIGGHSAIAFLSPALIFRLVGAAVLFLTRDEARVHIVLVSFCTRVLAALFRIF